MCRKYYVGSKSGMVLLAVHPAPDNRRIWRAKLSEGDLAVLNLARWLSDLVACKVMCRDCALSAYGEIAGMLLDSHPVFTPANRGRGDLGFHEYLHAIAKKQAAATPCTAAATSPAERLIEKIKSIGIPVAVIAAPAEMATVVNQAVSAALEKTLGDHVADQVDPKLPASEVIPPGPLPPDPSPSPLRRFFAWLTDWRLRKEARRGA